LGNSTGLSDTFHKREGKCDADREGVNPKIINKRAGGMGLILGRKAFKKTMADGVKLINAVQDVYLDNKVTIA